MGTIDSEKGSTTNPFSKFKLSVGYSEPTIVSLENKYLPFQLREQHYGIPLQYIRRVVSCPERINPSSSLPNSYIGFCYVEDTAVPIIDVAVKLGLPHIPNSLSPILILIDWNATPLNGETFVLALPVDSVDSVIEIEGDDESSIPSIEKWSSFIHSIYLHEEKKLLLLNIDLFLKEDFNTLMEFKNEIK